MQIGGNPTNETESFEQRRAQLLKEIADLEKQLASLKESMPAHSLSPVMFQRLEDLEYEIQQKRASLGHEQPQPES